MENSKNPKIAIFDSTLRDGAQAEGISFSVPDKLKIVSALDRLGIQYIEAGNPGSNPKDLDFFEQVSKMKLKNAKLTSFGSTRRRNINVEDDPNVISLLKANTPVVAIFGKSWDFHVTDIIKTTLEENLAMIRDTLAFFKARDKEVVFDAEHFFDGYKNNPEYALACLEAAVEGGADVLCLCDTNGGTFPSEVYEITKLVVAKFGATGQVEIGIHCHNDGGMAVANSVMAVEAGATHVQGTVNGFGERCGNANLCTIIPNLQIKKQYECMPQESLAQITSTARLISEIANVQLNERDPYVGNSAFAHKGGMHIDGVNKESSSFEHISPELVGNRRRFLMSEVSGRSMVLSKIQKVVPTLTKDSAETDEIIKKLKELEHQGYQFEGAESSFNLLVRKHLGKYQPFFDLIHFKIIGEQPVDNCSSTAIIKLAVDGKEEITAADGNGPVHALDKALRKALEGFYPELKQVHLTDYKVRVLETKTTTASTVRVLIESTDGEDVWTTVGVSPDIIEASWIALVDSIEHKLLKDMEQKMRVFM